MEAEKAKAAAADEQTTKLSAHKVARAEHEN